MRLLWPLDAILYFLLQWTLVLMYMVFNEHVRYIEQNLSVPSIFSMKTLTQNHGLRNTAFIEFLTISNKHIGFLLKFYHGFSQKYHIFELWSSSAIIESLKSVKFPMHEVARNSNSKHFYSHVLLFQTTLCLQLHYSWILWTMASLKSSISPTKSSRQIYCT